MVVMTHYARTRIKKKNTKNGGWNLKPKYHFKLLGHQYTWATPCRIEIDYKGNIPFPLHQLLHLLGTHLLLQKQGKRNITQQP